MIILNCKSERQKKNSNIFLSVCITKENLDMKEVVHQGPCRIQANLLYAMTSSLISYYKWQNVYKSVHIHSHFAA